MKKWFTLLEITIVIFVIAILMTMIVNFGANRVDFLQSNISKNNFVSKIETTYSNVLSSNYYWNQIISELDLEINKQENTVWISYNDTKYDEKLTKTEINSLVLDDDKKQDVTLKFKSYNIWCEIASDNQTWKQLYMQLNDKYCIQINSNNCKVLNIECENLES